MAVTAAAGDGGYGAEFPATSPGVTAVGGTTLGYTGTGPSLVWDVQTAWSGSGGGCSSYEAMPAWQQRQGVYSMSGDCRMRQVADVAADADPATGVAVYDTYAERGWMVFGGTSVSAQIIGASYGLAAGTGSLGARPQDLYPDATGTATGPTPGLVPVASGSNASCGTYLCNAADSLSSGYNGPTGLGTPNGVGAFSTGQVALATTSLSFSPTSETLGAGSPSGPIAVDLSSPAPSGGLAVTLTTTSAGGGFSPVVTGAFSARTTLTVPAGSTSSAPFYYEDTVAGSPTVTASATRWAAASLRATVSAGPLAEVTVSPSSVALSEGGAQVFTATGTDAYGNAVAVSPSWSSTVPGGVLSPGSGSSTTLRTGSTSGRGVVTATQSGLSGTAAVTVARSRRAPSH
jgi:hypothetical protein